ncbi:serine/arginine-rich splicing factor 1-like [Heterocephalus glaber]|uniref:Serine/arginine-rich splicing factor 1-like n=1 Tax=Heterocephalus glaber TaxID=10181 RepID=A0AAX6RIL6_HETGA|nr:serine/arginine-rich splicing factor 1-like [Heterocephalus glaber]
MSLRETAQRGQLRRSCRSRRARGAEGGGGGGGGGGRGDRAGPGARRGGSTRWPTLPGAEARPRDRKMDPLLLGGLHCPPPAG